MKAKEWEETMTPDEVNFLYTEFRKILDQEDEDGYPMYQNSSDHRAARVWISSQRRRFNKQEDRGCCGSYRNIVLRWNPNRQDFDKYLLGFNYGH